MWRRHHWQEETFLSCHTCHGMGPRVLLSHTKDPPPQKNSVILDVKKYEMDRGVPTTITDIRIRDSC